MGINEVFDNIGLLDAHPDPRGWIQWKGTEVCMDVHCICGELSHVDGEFCYWIKCGNCGRMYAVGQNVKLYLLTKEEAELAKNHTGFLVSKGD